MTGETMDNPNDPRRMSTTDRIAATVSGAAQGLADGIERTQLASSSERAIDQGGRMARLASVQREAIDHKVDQAKRVTRRAVERTQTAAHAVAESTRRASRAPGHIVEDLKQATSSYVGGIVAGSGFYAGAAFVGAIAAVAFTIALATGLNLLWGDAWGTLFVACLYAVGAFVLIGMAKAAQERGRVAAQGHIRQAREEVRSVTRPLRRAFAKDGRIDGIDNEMYQR